MIYSTEKFGVLDIATGGKSGYKNVRGGQGPNGDKFQGYTKGKKHTTKLYDTAREAAIELAILERDIARRPLAGQEAAQEAPHLQRNR